MSQTQIHRQLPLLCLTHVRLFETLLLKQSMTFYITHDMDCSSCSQWLFYWKALSIKLHDLQRDIWQFYHRGCYPVCINTAAVWQALSAGGSAAFVAPHEWQRMQHLWVFAYTGLLWATFLHLLFSPNTSPLLACFLWSLLSLDNSFLYFFHLLFFSIVCDMYVNACVCMFASM